MIYQQYLEEDDFHIANLTKEIADTLAEIGTVDRTFEYIASELVKRYFARVKVHTWCDRPSCGLGGCSPTHYSFHLKTTAREFEETPEHE